MPTETANPAFPMLLRPSGATLYHLRMETDQRSDPSAAAESGAVSAKPDTGWQTNDRIFAVAAFAADHPGFQGHFPGRPILPGFLHVQLAVDILRIYEPQAELTTVLSAKFHHPILPGAEIQIDLFRQLQNQATAKLQIGEEPASSMEFQFSTVSEPPPAELVSQTS